VLIGPPGVDRSAWRITGWHEGGDATPAGLRVICLGYGRYTLDNVVNLYEPSLRGHESGRGRGAPRKDRCKAGHPLEGDNLYVTPDGRGQCRACGAERARRRRANA
jgi:hypothetical protein